MVENFKDLSPQLSADTAALPNRLLLDPLQDTNHPLPARIHPPPIYYNSNIEFKPDKMSARLAFVETRDRLAKAQAARSPASAKKNKKHSNFLAVLGIMARKASHSTHRHNLKGSLEHQPGRSTPDAGAMREYSMRLDSGREPRTYEREQWIDAWIADVYGQVLPVHEESPPPYSP
ncbi:hypothetical protein G7Y79_00002g008230 [Physcia stellaris]|nr:hypothetical protein G7Y79_00002g008230 [Physcia stellaris]